MFFVNIFNLQESLAIGEGDENFNAADRDSLPNQPPWRRQQALFTSEQCYPYQLDTSHIEAV
jgi:hypothetical protein